MRVSWLAVRLHSAHSTRHLLAAAGGMLFQAAYMQHCICKQPASPRTLKAISVRNSHLTSALSASSTRQMASRLLGAIHTWHCTQGPSIRFDLVVIKHQLQAPDMPYAACSAMITVHSFAGGQPPGSTEPGRPPPLLAARQLASPPRAPTCMLVHSSRMPPWVPE